MLRRIVGFGIGALVLLAGCAPRPIDCDELRSPGDQNPSASGRLTSDLKDPFGRCSETTKREQAQPHPGDPRFAFVSTNYPGEVLVDGQVVCESPCVAPVPIDGQVHTIRFDAGSTPSQPTQ